MLGEIDLCHPALSDPSDELKIPDLRAEHVHAATYVRWSHPATVSGILAGLPAVWKGVAALCHGAQPAAASVRVIPVLMHTWVERCDAVGAPERPAEAGKAGHPGPGQVA